MLNAKRPGNGDVTARDTEMKFATARPKDFSRLSKNIAAVIVFALITRVRRNRLSASFFVALSRGSVN